MDVDVVIVGAGGAGLSAAVEAADAGASVILFEAAGSPGGSTAMSAGVFYAACTSVQAAAGVKDSVERMFSYYMTLNQWNIEPWLVRRLCEESGPALEWLIGMGVEYPAEKLYQAGVDDVPRGHLCAGGGAALVRILTEQTLRRGVKLECGVRVSGLITGNGAVRGVRLPAGTIESGSVVLTTGGIGANEELVRELYPQALRDGPEWTNYFGSPTSNGDGLVMGREAGAAIVGKGRGLLNWTAGFSREPADFCPPWIVFVNSEGRRFMAENAPYTVAGDLIRMQTGGRCVAILDESARAASTAANTRRDQLGVGAYTWSAESLDQQRKLGRVLRADTLEELARAAGIHPTALVNTISSYNADVAKGTDSRFFKSGELKPVATPPFYAVEIRPSTFGMTAAGLRIDPDARVYSVDEIPIAGLYAAGETAGGVFGDRYVGGGNAITNAIVYGRIAGREAAAAALGNARPGPVGSSG